MRFELKDKKEQEKIIKEIYDVFNEHLFNYELTAPIRLKVRDRNLKNRALAVWGLDHVKNKETGEDYYGITIQITPKFIEQLGIELLYETETDQAHALGTVILHEMIHEYTFEYRNPNGNRHLAHDEWFFKVGKDHDFTAVIENDTVIEEKMGEKATAIIDKYILPDF